MAFRLLTKQNSYIHGHSDRFAPADSATDFTEPLGFKIRDQRATNGNLFKLIITIFQHFPLFN